jgi:hypothetical protein
MWGRWPPGQRGRLRPITLGYARPAANSQKAPLLVAGPSRPPAVPSGGLEDGLRSLRRPWIEAEGRVEKRPPSCPIRASSQYSLATIASPIASPIARCPSWFGCGQLAHTGVARGCLRRRPTSRSDRGLPGLRRATLRGRSPSRRRTPIRSGTIPERSSTRQSRGSWSRTRKRSSGSRSPRRPPGRASREGQGTSGRLKGQYPI